MERIGLQDTDFNLMNNLLLKFCQDAELRRLLELFLLEKQYNQAENDGLLEFIKSLSMINERVKNNKLHKTCQNSTIGG